MASDLPFTRSLLAGIRVVLLDSNRDDLEVLTAALKESGAEVMAFFAAAEALTELDGARPDVFVTDISIPGLDTKAFMRALRASEVRHGREIQAIALTKFRDEYPRQRAFEAGFTTNCAKPCDPRDLVRLVARLVGRR